MQQHSHHSHHQARPAIAQLGKVRMCRVQRPSPRYRNSSCEQRVRLVVLNLRLVRPRE